MGVIDVYFVGNLAKVPAKEMQLIMFEPHVHQFVLYYQL
jgi:hypothetical protein